MITRIQLSGLKRFRSQTFDIRPLTILAGLNGSGKTSLIHAILLAHEATASSDTVRLNELFGLELGTAVDVRNWDADGAIEVTIEASGVSYTWVLGADSDASLYLNVMDKPRTPPDCFSGGAKFFSYLAAERQGPRNLQNVAPYPRKELVVGTRGEYSAQIIDVFGGRPMEYLDRRHPASDERESSLLKYEVERWLAEIARPVEIEAETFSGSPVAALKFRSPGGVWVRAPNMGFGVSYALPIILAGLVVPTGGLILVENPEAHLHPAGQSRIGTFLGWIAGKGVQIIVETHSDHILNGIRRAIGEFEYLRHDDAVVNFFGEDDAAGPTVQNLDFTRIGGISHWPRGFFDQFQIDTAQLGRIRRPNQ